MTTRLAALQDWVDSVARLTQPEDIHWCNGSDSEYKRLVNQMSRTGDLLELDREEYPHCYLHRSHPSDVARVEHLTFVCSKNEVDAGPNNNWMDPSEAHHKVDGLFAGTMQGRTMYV
ncbi:MAG TPA: phosphoenolpyruvate carboxykinase, partial [Woeseiaceae bacterium]|nr:phosphoenolpyruvate carboxykinase [Woeseiaceae bacterium]